MRQPGVPHSTTLDPGSGWLECFVGIGPCLAAALRRAEAMPATEPVWRWGVRPARTARFVALRAALADQPLPQLMAQAIALITEACAAAVPLPTQDPLQVAAVLLAGERAPSPQTVAAQVGLPYSRFRRAFSRRHGLAPAAYRLRRQIDHAGASLIGGAEPVAAIAARLGYANPFAFTNRFTAIVGISPSGYRRRGG